MVAANNYEIRLIVLGCVILYTMTTHEEKKFHLLYCEGCRHYTRHKPSDMELVCVDCRDESNFNKWYSEFFRKLSFYGKASSESSPRIS